MKTQMSQRKASKGTVQIKNSNERLQLVFSYTGKRHYLSTGFTDTPANRKLAEMKARQIELDILSGNFDPTLVTNRGWKSILAKLDGIEYRKLYQTRHTFITLALDNKMDVKDVAKLVGNSPEVIYRHYAGQSREIVVPDF
jgi:integrase